MMMENSIEEAQEEKKLYGKKLLFMGIVWIGLFIFALPYIMDGMPEIVSIVGVPLVISALFSHYRKIGVIKEDKKGRYFELSGLKRFYLISGRTTIQKFDLFSITLIRHRDSRGRSRRYYTFSSI